MSNRRRFLSVAAAQLVVYGSALRLRDSGSPPAPGAIGEVKQIDAGVLNVGYAEVGPTGGPGVILLHGWPYDIHTYVDVAPVLAGETLQGDRPLSTGLRYDAISVMRDGSQRSAIGLGLRHRRADGCARDRKAIVAGCDWGARTANVADVDRF